MAIGIAAIEQGWRVANALYHENAFGPVATLQDRMNAIIWRAEEATLSRGRGYDARKEGRRNAR